MGYKKLFIHQEKVSVLIPQEELIELIVSHVSAKSGLKVDKATVKNIKDRRMERSWGILLV